MTITASTTPSRQVELVKAEPLVRIGTQLFSVDDLNPSIVKFNQFWDYMDTIYIHGFTRAAMSVIGRSAVGAWWSLVKHKEFEKEARPIQHKRLYNFYMMTENRAWDNIHDYQSFAFKLMIAIQYLRYFGRAAFLIVRNREDTAIGMDFLPGLVIPNVDDRGKFKSPAFVQYPTDDIRDKIEFNSPRDIVFISNPDWEGDAWGGSDIESLASYTLPLDIYLQAAASGYMQNRDMPSGIYQLSPDVDDDGFESFQKQIKEVYRGPENTGRSLLTVRGEVDFKEVSRLPSDLPYQEARGDTRKEILAVSGASAPKLGLLDDVSNANMRENRREFHETTMIPIFKFIELGFYEQVHIREFNVKGWEFKFNQPDFLTGVEVATVDMRYYGMGVYNPNELRAKKGMPPRTDDQGDLYIDQLINPPPGAGSPTGGRPGSPPEGNDDRPDSPGNVGEPRTDPEPPERGDGHDDVSRDDSGLFSELRRWRSYAVGRVRKGRSLRRYESEVIPLELGNTIQAYLDEASTIDDVKDVFNEVFAVFDEEGGNEEE